MTRRYFNRYNSHERGSPGVEPGGPSLTKQSFRKECDINRIMAKYVKTGELPPGLGVGRYGDFSQASDYLEALQTIESSQKQFASLPSGVRTFFRNDPSVMLEFVSNPDNLEKAHELGLLSQEGAERLASRRVTQAPSASPGPSPAPSSPIAKERPPS